MLLSDNETDCRKFTVCNEKNCSGMTTLRIKTIFYKVLVSFCIRLCELFCSDIDPFFVTYAFKNYKRGVDFFSPYLEIETLIVSVNVSGKLLLKNSTLTLIFMFQKKKLVDLSSMKPLISYENVKAINNFIRTYWNHYFFLSTFIFVQN